jgi:large subunit ribosomal protein L15
MLHSLRPATGSRKSKKRIARGNSGAGGTTGGRGTKGQQSRVGKGRRFGFEGGQVPLIRRQPKLGGFTSIRRKNYEVVTLASLEKKLPAGTYTLQDLVTKRVVRNGHLVKLLATGSVSKKFELQAHAASKAAVKAIKDAGGTLTIVKSAM